MRQKKQVGGANTEVGINVNGRKKKKGEMKKGCMWKSCMNPPDP